MNAYTLLEKESTVNKAKREMSERMQTIAKTILSQIKAADYWALAAWGANNYVAYTEGDQGGEIGYILGGIQFNVRGAKVNRGGRVIVYLMPNDTYTVRVGRLYRNKWKDIKIVHDVYCDMLMNVIDRIIER